MLQKNIASILFILLSSWSFGQNLVPNPSFETMNDCEFIQPEITCLQNWSDLLQLNPINTPDLGFEGAVFFPPSTINAQDGNQYLNLECSTGNPEYIQVALLQPMTAGTTYCVSFYASHSQESPEVAPSLGIYFTDEPITDSPFYLGLEASVQGPINFDPTSWTLITGSFVAAGGEDVLVLGGFENTGTMPFPYMYVDMLSVVPMPSLILNDVQLCDDDVLLDVSAPGATYLWNNGANTSSIAASTLGEYSVIRTIGSCTQETTVNLIECETDIDITDPTDTIPNDSIIHSVVDSLAPPLSFNDYNFFIPNAFTPDGDGTNDVFGVEGPKTDTFHLQIYNRWGQLIYDSIYISQRWTGNHLGGSYFVPDGVYVYHMKATEGTWNFEEKGHIMLMR